MFLLHNTHNTHSMPFPTLSIQLILSKICIKTSSVFLGWNFLSSSLIPVSPSSVSPFFPFQNIYYFLPQVVYSLAFSECSVLHSAKSQLSLKFGLFFFSLFFLWANTLWLIALYIQWSIKSVIDDFLTSLVFVFQVGLYVVLTCGNLSLYTVWDFELSGLTEFAYQRL